MNATPPVTPPVKPNDPAFLELEEHRKAPEPIIKVWDFAVRAVHWLLVIFFSVIYFRYNKFPLHAYAGELIMILVMLRLVWGFIGSKGAKFTSFWYTPSQVLAYTRDAVKGHAGYYASHNPMGSWMVYTLLSLMLVNGILGLMLYSSGQQLGPLGDMVPDTWEDTLLGLHKALGHFTAACVAMHIGGVLWAARQHRENYVLAMLTGHKRVPRKMDETQIAGYAVYSEEAKINPALRTAERWFNYRHPFMSSVLIVGIVLLVVYQITEVLANINKHLLAF